MDTVCCNICRTCSRFEPGATAPIPLTRDEHTQTKLKAETNFEITAPKSPSLPESSNQTIQLAYQSRTRAHNVS